MRRIFAFAAAVIGFAANTASAEIIELNGTSVARTTVIRGAPERCNGGPAIIRVGDAASRRPARCAAPVSDRTDIRIQVNNFVAVFLDDRHKPHYKRHH